MKAVFLGAVGLSGLFSLAMCAGMMAFLGWVFFRIFEDNFAAGLAVTLVLAFVIGVPVYVTRHLGWKMGRQLQSFPEEYRQRMKAKGEMLAGRDDAQGQRDIEQRPTD